MWIPRFLAGSISGHACWVFCCLISSCQHHQGNASHSDRQPWEINVCNPRGIVSSGCWWATISTFISKLVLGSLLIKRLSRISFQIVGGVPCQRGSDDGSGEQRHSLGAVQILHCSCHHLITVVGFLWHHKHLAAPFSSHCRQWNGGALSTSKEALNMMQEWIQCWYKGHYKSSLREVWAQASIGWAMYTLLRLEDYNKISKANLISKMGTYSTNVLLSHSSKASEVATLYQVSCWEHCEMWKYITCAVASTPALVWKASSSAFLTWKVWKVKQLHMGIPITS